MWNCIFTLVWRWETYLKGSEMTGQQRSLYCCCQLFTWNLTWRLQYKPESGLLFVAKKRTWSQKKSIGSWISCESLQYLIYHFTAKLQISISQMINHLVHLMSCYVDDWKQSGKWTFSCMKLLGKRTKKKDILFLFDFKSESY